MGFIYSITTQLLFPFRLCISFFFLAKIIFFLFISVSCYLYFSNLCPDVVFIFLYPCPCFPLSLYIFLSLPLYSFSLSSPFSISIPFSLSLLPSFFPSPTHSFFFYFCAFLYTCSNDSCSLENVVYWSNS